MKRILILLLVLSVGANVSLAVRMFGQRSGAPAREWRGRDSWPAHGDTQAWHERIERRAEHMGHRLNLGPEQQEVFRRTHEKAGRDLLQQRGRVDERRQAVQKVIARDPVDREAVLAAIGELSHEQAVMDSLVAEKLLEGMEMLDSGQRMELLKMLRWKYTDDAGPPRDGRGHGRHEHGKAGQPSNR